MKFRYALAAAAIAGVFSGSASGKLAPPSGWSADEAKAIAAWPARKATGKLDPATEAKIARIVAGMTLEQKVGQMTQAEIRYVTPDQVRKFYIGTILNGGGAWPEMNKQASARDWADLADRFAKAAMSTDMKVQIPLIWGIDAVHGNNNVHGATMFPHNIGLGATRDPNWSTGSAGPPPNRSAPRASAGLSRRLSRWSRTSVGAGLMKAIPTIRCWLPAWAGR